MLFNWKLNIFKHSSTTIFALLNKQGFVCKIHSKIIILTHRFYSPRSASSSEWIAAGDSLLSVE